MKKAILLLSAFIMVAVMLVSCSKDEEDKSPILTIMGDAFVTSRTAVLSATIDDRGSAITTGGFYWSRKPNPTANDSVLTGITLNNLLSASLEELPQGETFYYCAFATSAEGTGVSSPKSFTTIHNVPKLEILVDSVAISDHVTVNSQTEVQILVKCSMLVPNEFVSLSLLRISYAHSSTGTLVEQIVAGSYSEYNTSLTFSNTGEIDLIFELFDEYNNLTTRTITVTVIDPNQ